VAVPVFHLAALLATMISLPGGGRYRDRSPCVLGVALRPAASFTAAGGDILETPGEGR
jgi:hypothetical protein